MWLKRHFRTTGRSAHIDILSLANASVEEFVDDAISSEVERNNFRGWKYCYREKWETEEGFFIAASNVEF